MSDDKSDAAFILLFIGGFLALGLWAGARLNQSTTDDWWRDELARRGVAHYYLDAENRRQWNWIEPQKVEARP